MDQFYYESGYIDASYFVYTADAESTPSSTFSIACDATIIAGGEIVEGTGSWMSNSSVAADGNLVAGGTVAMNSAFSQTATISHINGADLFAMSNAELAAEVSRIRDNNIQVSGAYTLAASVARTRWISGSMDAAVAVTANDSRVRYNQADMSSAFSIAAVARRIQQGAAALTASSSVNVVAARVQQGAAQLNSTAAIACSAQTIKLASAQLSSAFEQTATLSSVTGRPRQLIHSDSASFNTDRVLGSHSLYKSSSDTVWYNGSNDYNIAAGQDFVVEGFVKTTNTTESVIIGTYGWSIEQQYSSGSGYRFRFNYRSGSTYTVNSAYLAQSPQVYWTYFGIYKVGNSLYIKTSQLVDSVWTTPVITTVSVSTLNTFGTDAAVYDYQKLLGIGSATNYTVGGSSHFAGLIDEFYFAKNTSQLQQFATSGVANEIIVGADSNTQFLFHLNNNFNDDVHGVAQATAALNSAVTLSATVADRTRSVTANLQCNGFEAVVIGRIRPETAGLDSRFTLAANAGRRIFRSCCLSSNFTVTASALDLDLAQAALTSTATMSVTGKTTARLRNQNLSSAATLSAVVTVKYAKEWPGSYVSLLHLDGNTYDEITKTNQSSSGIDGYVTATSGFGTKMSGSHPYISLNTFNPSGNPLVDTLPSFSIDMKVKMVHGAVDIDESDLVSFNTYYGNYSLLKLVSDPVTNNAEWLEFGGNIVNSKPYNNNYWATERHVEIRYTQSIASPNNNTFLYIDGQLISASRTISSLRAPLSNMVVGAKPVAYGTRTYSFDEIRLQIGTYFPAPTTVPYQQIENAYADLYSTSSISVATTKLVRTTAALSCAFTNNTNGNRIRFGNSALTAQATCSTVGQRNAILQANLQSTASTAITAKKYNGSGAVLSSNFTQSTVAQKSAVVNATFNSAFTQVTNNSRKRATDITVNSQFTVNASVIKTARTTGHFDAFVTELSIVNRIGRGFIHMDSTALVTASAQSTRDVPVHLSSNSTLTTNAITVQFGQAQLTAQATVAANVDKIKKITVDLQVNSSVNCTVSVIRRTSASMSTAAQLTANTNNSLIVGMSADLNSNSTLTVNNQIVRLAQSTMTAEFMMPDVIAGIMVRFEANLVCEGFELVSGDVIHIDPYYQIQIKPETRYYLIEPETRIRVVKSETRVNKIKGTVK